MNIIINKIMKKINKKSFFALISAIISILGLITICLGFYSQKYDTYSFYVGDTSNKIFINEIRLGDSIVNLSDYEYNDSKYSNKLSKIILSSNENYVIKKSKIDNLKVSFDNQTNNQQEIVVKKNKNESKTIKLKSNSMFVYVDNIGTFSIVKLLINDLTFLQIVLCIVIFLLFSLIVYLSLTFVNKFMVNIANGQFFIFEFIVSTFLLLIINLIYIFPLMQISKYLSVVPMVVALIVIIFHLRKKMVVKLHTYYIIIAMFIGVIFLLVFPPLHVPDETLHIIKSYQTSYVFKDNHEITKDTTYAYLPKDFESFVKKYGSQTLNYEYRMQPRTYTYDIFRLTDYNEISKNYSWYGLKYTPSITYLPGTITAFIARTINMPILLYYYLSRILTYIISVLMCYYAIKIVPKFKKVFFLVPLLPIFIQQSFGFNVDWLTNVLFILLLAFIIKNIYSNEPLNKSDNIKMYCLSIMLGFCKFGYFPIALLLLLISNNKDNLKHKNRYNKIILMGIIILTPLLVTIFYRIYSNRVYSNYAGCTVSTRTLIPISTLWTNPQMLISIIIETFKQRLDLDFFRGLVTGFGWSTIWSNSLYLFISMVILMSIILCYDENNIKLTIKQKIIFIISFLLMCGLIYGAMLFGWSEIGSISIDGLQPRYFIPPIMLLYILLQNKYIQINVKDKDLFYALGMIIINVLGLLTILEKIYI